MMAIDGIDGRHRGKWRQEMDELAPESGFGLGVENERADA